MSWPISSACWETESVRLTKHHGLGNDFLVVLDEANGRACTIDEALARRLCDRRTGVGADGLIRGEQPGPDQPAGVDVVMHLHNSDGSRAEMSGNGIRCLAQALALTRQQQSATFAVLTDAGVRHVELTRNGSTDADVSVGMGTARPGPRVPGPVEEELDARHATVDLGNPHLVVESSDPGAVDLVTRGAWLEQQFDGGVNVEFIAKDDGRPDAIVLRVWERGAGVTMACGTGACAAAHAAHSWGLVGERVTVEMPGGTAEVRLGDELVLTGPAVLVAAVEVPDG
jgi:diaminopimelate epimerase